MKPAKTHLISLFLIFLSTPFLFPYENIIFGFPAWCLYSIIICIIFALVLNLLMHYFWSSLENIKCDSDE